MKVCDIVMNSIWYDPRVRKQISEYMERSIELVCVGMRCSRYDPEKVKQIPCKVVIPSINPRYNGKQHGIWRKLYREWLVISAVKKAVVNQKPDVIHANDLDALIPAYVASRKLKCRLIYDSHEINVENCIANRSRLFVFIMRAIEKFITRRVDLMVCVSHSAAEYFSSEYKIPTPMVVTNCSIKRERTEIPQTDKHLGFEVLNHGQFYEGRGYDIMAEALPYLANQPDIKLAIRGFGQMEKQLHDLVDMASNKEQFIFYPPVNVHELIPYAAMSHVGVAITIPICINFKLSVSNKLFEYTSAGLPVIMSNIPEHKYLNDKYHFGIIIEHDAPEDLCDAVLKLYTDKDFYFECKKNAMAMTAELNWENEFGKLIAFEKNLVSNKTESLCQTS